LGVGAFVLSLLPALFAPITLSLRLAYVGMGTVFLLLVAAMMLSRIVFDGAVLTLRGVLTRRRIDLRELASADGRIGARRCILKLRDRSGRKIRLDLSGFRGADRLQLLVDLAGHIYAPKVERLGQVDRYFREVGGFDPAILATTDLRAVFPESFT
jgi:hypothetical protein